MNQVIFGAPTLAALFCALALPVVAQQAAVPTEPAADAAAEAAAVPQGSYAFDPHHAQAVFVYDHMGFSRSFGVVNEIAGEVVLDAADPAKSSVKASFPLSALRTISPALDAHLTTADFFDGDEEEISFVSTAVEVTGERKARVTGDLTMNGVTRPVVLDMVLNTAALNPIEQRPAVGFTGTTTILRSDFGLGAFAPAVSDAVEITLNVEAIKG